MPDNSYSPIRTLLSSSDLDDLNRGLDLAAVEISKVGINEAEPLFEMLSSLFYVDPFDRPELLPAINKAINLTVSFGSGIIPMLLQHLDTADFKAQWAVANVLGRIGAGAINPLVAAYGSTKKATLRAFILYALGKIKSPEILYAVAIVLDALQSSDLELRDTATRSLGKFMESIQPGSLSKEQKRQCLECLRGNLSDPDPSVRSKAVRSLSKMARYGHFTDSERKQLEAVCQNILGIDAAGEWDRAYIVRKEAEEALNNL